MQDKIQENPMPEEKKCCLPCCSCSGWKMVVCVVIGLLIVGGAVYAGYFLGRKSISPRELLIPPKPITTQIPIDNGPVEIEVSPTLEVPAGWKTYRNEKYGFEIKYPAGWLVNLIDNTVRFQTFPEPSPGYGGFPGDTNDVQVSLSVKANPDNLTLEKYFTKQSLGRVVKSKQPVVLGNISGMMVTYDEEVNAGMPEVYSIVNNSLIEGIVYSGSSVKEKAISTFDQILSTFRFLD